MSNISKYHKENSDSTVLDIAKTIETRFDAETDFLICYNPILEGKAVMMTFAKHDVWFGNVKEIGLTVLVNECPEGIEVTAVATGSEQKTRFIYSSEELFVARLEEILTELGFQKENNPEVINKKE